jgi:hypothetical protein
MGFGGEDGYWHSERTPSCSEEGEEESARPDLRPAFDVREWLRRVDQTKPLPAVVNPITHRRQVFWAKTTLTPGSQCCSCIYSSSAWRVHDLC